MARAPASRPLLPLLPQLHPLLGIPGAVIRRCCRSRARPCRRRCLRRRSLPPSPTDYMTAEPSSPESAAAVHPGAAFAAPVRAPGPSPAFPSRRGLMPRRWKRLHIGAVGRLIFQLDLKAKGRVI